MTNTDWAPHMTPHEHDADEGQEDHHGYRPPTHPDDGTRDTDDPRYCSDCQHPDGYHDSKRGCTMPLGPSGSPASRNETQKGVCGCGRPKPDADERARRIDLPGLLALDKALSAEVDRVISERADLRSVLVNLAVTWIRQYGGMGPGRTQRIGRCTRCYLTFDEDDVIRVARAGDWPHRPLADQDCIKFTTGCPFDCGTERVWVPLAWLERQLHIPTGQDGTR